ncbi:DUF2777 family protein [Alkalicoccus halolimnae]|uniref:DUF2777 family protein n=1 Tax=Alkalicoccus halolimnae TaxID=1667239 RepID=A0A5C7FIL4_9BACI|nr:DUF2777 family protein [Alkalicoccus halolimnae]TXF87157.1 DUF2777 family protein [Alkalicoccus halolimnae]
MNRKEAKRWIGKYVTIDEGVCGSYAGLLEAVHTSPGTPWTAEILIKGVIAAPAFNNTDSFKPLKYEKDETVLAKGSKVHSYSEDFTYSYRESYAAALKKLWDEKNNLADDLERSLSLIQQELRKWQMEHMLVDASYVYYKVFHKDGSVYIYDENKKDALGLEGFPFEFEVLKHERWTPAYYINNGIFEDRSGSRIRIKPGENIRLNKEQFDPYKMLINEVSDPSLQALERGLKKMNIGHEHCVHCHNSLLMKMLASYNSEEFTGVNFLTYSTGTDQVLVQHHYERRSFPKTQQEVTFDRFEFTHDSGKRILTTYTNQVSQDQ